MLFTKEAQNQLKLCQGETQLVHNTWPALSSLLWLRTVHASPSEASSCVERSLHLCNVDFIGADIDVIDSSTSEIPQEHKSFNLLELENGQLRLK